jgi:hypothetical protein
LLKSPFENGGSRGLAPLGCLPLWGREGVTIVIPHPLAEYRNNRISKRVKKETSTLSPLQLSPLLPCQLADLVANLLSPQNGLAQKGKIDSIKKEFLQS